LSNDILDVNKKKSWKELQDMIDDDDLYNEEAGDSYGRENEPHVTILYGLHDDIKDKDIEVDIKEINSLILNLKIYSLILIMINLDVLKFDVESEDLNKLNKVFSDYPNTNKFPDSSSICTWPI
jgi:hypothetical protein